MESVTIFLTDPDAANYPFPYKIDDRLKSPTKNIQGTIRNAKYGYPDYVGPLPCWTTSCIETDNGELIQLPLIELNKIGFLKK